jgi:hypothetical protein
MNHEKEILKGKIDLYIDYISFFNISQFKYMKRLHAVYSEFDKQLKHTVNDHHSFSFQDILQEDNADVLVMDVIKDGISDEENFDLAGNEKNMDINKDEKNEENSQTNELLQHSSEDVPVFESLDKLNDNETSGK